MLETARLQLRTMLPGDYNALLEIFTDPNVMAAFGTELLTAEQMHGWLKRNLDHQDEHGYGLFSVIRKEDGRLIGNCGLEVMLVEGQPVCELGYDFRSDCWNQGYATEAATAVRDHAFGVLNLPRLIALIRVGNEPSRRVAEKIGMTLELAFDRGDIRYWRYGMANPAT